MSQQIGPNTILKALACPQLMTGGIEPQMITSRAIDLQGFGKLPFCSADGAMFVTSLQYCCSSSRAIVWIILPVLLCLNRSETKP